MPAADLTGQLFGRLLVTGRAGTDKNRKTLWACDCACGATATVRGQDLRAGKTSSCGCAQTEAIVAPADSGRCLECRSSLAGRRANTVFCNNECFYSYHSWISGALAVADPLMLQVSEWEDMRIQPYGGPKRFSGPPKTEQGWVRALRYDRKNTANPHLKVIGVNDGWKPGKYS